MFNFCNSFSEKFVLYYTNNFEKMKETEVIFIVEESNEGGFEAKALGHSIYTDADDLASLKSNIIDAVKCHFEEAKVPSVVRLHFVRDELIAV